MAHNRTQLNGLIFHNQIVLPRSSPGFGEVSLAVAELQGGNYAKAALLAEIAVGKDPQLAAGWLAKTAADVFEATPSDLRTDRAVFCLERAMECAPTCRADMVEFFAATIFGHYVRVLREEAVAQAGQWKAHEAQAVGAACQAGISAGLGLVTAMTALFSRRLGVKVLSGLTSAAAFSESNRLQGESQLMNELGNDHRAASLVYLLAARDLVELGLDLLRNEGLPRQPFDPVIQGFVESFRDVWASHLVSLCRLHQPITDAINGKPKRLKQSYANPSLLQPFAQSPPVRGHADLDGPHPASAATLRWLERMLPGVSKLDEFQLVMYPARYVRSHRSWLGFNDRLHKFVLSAWMVDSWMQGPAGGVLASGYTSAVATRTALPLPGAKRTEPAGCMMWAAWGVVTVFCLFVALVILGVMVGHPSQQGPGTASPVPARNAAEDTKPPPSSASAGPDKQATPKVRRAIPVAATASPVVAAAPAFPAPQGGKFYEVVGVANSDALNVHTGPGANTSVSARLPNRTIGIEVTGASVMNGPTEWVPIRVEDRTGWVTKQHLQPE